MALQIPTGIGSRHVLGDLVYRTYNLANAIADGDTMVINQNRVEVVTFNTSNTAVGVTWANNTPAGTEQATLTFHSTGTWTGQIGVFSRIG